MPVNIAQWCAGIGRFHSRSISQKTKNNFSGPIIIFKRMLTFFYNVFLSIFILKVGDIELNPEHKKNPSFTFFLLPLDSLTTDNYSKVLALIPHLSQTTKTLC